MAEQEQEGMKLSAEDIEALATDPSTENKVKIVEKLSKQYNSSEFSKKQIAHAEQIFRNLLKDTEIEVRKALSESIVSSDIVPKDVVMSLAKDVEAVACPVLEFSDVFTEEDLIEIVKESENAAHQVAVANRANLGEGISDALVDTGNESVVENLMKNDSAKITEQSFEKVVSQYSKNELVVDSLVTRGTVSEKIISKMADAISEKMQKRIEARYNTSFKEINTVFKEGSEAASLKVLGQQKIDEELLELIENLKKNEKLEESLKDRGSRLNAMIYDLGKDGKLPAISSLSLGHLILFEIIVSEMTGIPYSNVERLVEDKKGIEAIYMKSKLPPQMRDVATLAIETILDIYENERLEAGEKIRNNPNVFIKELTHAGKHTRIRNLSQFISIIKDNIEKRRGAW